jgi:hypothetical protein
MDGQADLDAMARRVIDGNHYLTLATREADGRPRLSPVYYTAARYTDFYWVSSPEAQHSRNLTEHPDIEIVIFDSTAEAGAGEAVYLSATARKINDDDLVAVLPEAFRTTAGARRFEADELRGDAPLRLYVATVTSCEVHVRGSDRYTAVASTPANQPTQDRPERERRPPNQPRHDQGPGTETETAEPPPGNETRARTKRSCATPSPPPVQAALSGQNWKFFGG